MAQDPLNREGRRATSVPSAQQMPKTSGRSLNRPIGHFGATQPLQGPGKYDSDSRMKAKRAEHMASVRGKIGYGSAPRTNSISSKIGDRGKEVASYDGDDAKKKAKPKVPPAAAPAAAPRASGPPPTPVPPQGAAPGGTPLGILGLMAKIHAGAPPQPVGQPPGAPAPMPMHDGEDAKGRRARNAAKKARARHPGGGEADQGAQGAQQGGGGGQQGPAPPQPPSMVSPTGPPGLTAPSGPGGLPPIPLGPNRPGPMGLDAEHDGEDAGGPLPPTPMPPQIEGGPTPATPTSSTGPQMPKPTTTTAPTPPPSAVSPGWGTPPQEPKAAAPPTPAAPPAPTGAPTPTPGSGPTPQQPKEPWWGGYGNAPGTAWMNEFKKDGEDSIPQMPKPSVGAPVGKAPKIRPELSGGPVQPMGGAPSLRRFRMGHPGAMDAECDHDGDCEGKHDGIHIKPSHKGLLHKDLGVKEGSPIPESKLESAKNSSDPAVRKRATFAENAKHWNHDGEGK